MATKIVNNNIDKEYKIYCLKDPEDMSIRYIGKTQTSFSSRMKIHIHQSKINNKPTHKEYWIRNLINKNKKPIIEIIEVVDKDNWREREIFWILFYKNIGCKLTNLTNGGDGHNGIVFSDDWKRIHSERMKGNKYGVGFKWTNEQRIKMMASRKSRKGIAGKPHSEETKLKISIAHKTRIENGLFCALSKHQFNKSREVSKYDKNGFFIISYKSVSEASIINNIKRQSIYENIRGANKTAHGFIYKYK
jgi:hypothetical protein